MKYASNPRLIHDVYIKNSRKACRLFCMWTGAVALNNDSLVRQAPSKLLGLLFELNRRVPNGMHGGVRGATG